MKNNTKFTPGPWHLNTLENPMYSIHANRGVVAEVSRGTMNEVSADEREATARLIAAAPELLAACEQTHKFLDMLQNSLGKNIEATSHIRLLFNAISKAKGA